MDSRTTKDHEGYLGFRSFNWGVTLIAPVASYTTAYDAELNPRREPASGELMAQTSQQLDSAERLASYREGGMVPGQPPAR
ncbi:MAG: hypothetical protein ABEK00_03865 [Candidatus Nanohaloarchaea archaeon]